MFYQAPLDYANQSLGTVELAMFKLGASSQNQTYDAVFYNPGGPGDDPYPITVSCYV